MKAGSGSIVIAGYSAFTWALVTRLRGEVKGRLYYVLADVERAMEASLLVDVLGVRGEITDTDVLDQLDLGDCHTFVAGSEEEQANVLSALYAKNKGARYVYARVYDVKLTHLLESVGITPVVTAFTAAGFMAIDILKPAVADLVSLGRGQFELEEIQASDFPELLGCRLGNLQGELLHIVAVAQGDKTWLSYNTLIEEDCRLIIIYDRQIRKRLRQEIRRVAEGAVQKKGKR
jgi:Trk K+ transport system NAD-binding subunit